mmetsp:Transcript_15537/g.24864  ORF Transcript_15537/g.24864 Transcript_15537/m.24864 type:complete len:87 (+) Transcript_15537:808-1068(+)
MSSANFLSLYSRLRSHLSICAWRSLFIDICFGDFEKNSDERSPINVDAMRNSSASTGTGEDLLHHNSLALRPDSIIQKQKFLELNE